MNHLLFLALTVLTAPPPSPTTQGRELVDRIVAVVNEDVITLSELRASTGPYLEQNNTEIKRNALDQQVLDTLIAEKLLNQQVKEAKIEVTAEEIERAIEDILKQHSITKDDLKAAVEQRGMSMAQYKEDIEHQLVRLKLIDLKVRSRVTISDSDLKSEYDKASALEKRDELVKLRHLFFRWGENASATEKARVLERARKGRARVVGGEDFAKVATEISEGPTASSGGDLGEVSQQGLLPELARAVNKMKPNEISAPIETDTGVHVVRLEGTRQKDPAPFEQSKNAIYQRLYTQEVERQMKAWVDELRAASAVDIRL